MTSASSPSPAYDEQNYGTLPEYGWDVAMPETDDGDDTVLISSQNHDLGDFSFGRFAWLLDRIHVLADPRPCVGRQGLWTWPVPADLRSLLT